MGKRKIEGKKRLLKFFCFIFVFVVVAILVGCSLPGRLTVQDVRQDTVKTIYVDTWVWYDKIPFNLKKWFHLQVFKPLAAQKLQEYFEKAGWIVTNKHLKIVPQKIEQIPCPLWRKRCRDYETWLDMYMWTNKKRMTLEDIRAYIKAKYALFFAYYPSPKNVKEYEIKIILGKLKDSETMRKVFEKVKKQGYEVEFSTLCLKTFAKDLWIKKPLIFTVKKFEDYVATRVFMVLKEWGMIDYRTISWKKRMDNFKVQIKPEININREKKTGEIQKTAQKKKEFVRQKIVVKRDSKKLKPVSRKIKTIKTATGSEKFHKQSSSESETKDLKTSEKKKSVSLFPSNFDMENSQIRVELFGIKNKIMKLEIQNKTKNIVMPMTIILNYNGKKYKIFGVETSIYPFARKEIKANLSSIWSDLKRKTSRQTFGLELKYLIVDTGETGSVKGKIEK